MVQAFVWLTPVGPLRLLHEFQVEDGTVLCKQVVAYTEGGVRDARMQYPLKESHKHTQNKGTLGQLSVQRSTHHCFTNYSRLRGLHTVQDALVNHITTLCSKRKGLPVQLLEHVTYTLLGLCTFPF